MVKKGDLAQNKTTVVAVGLCTPIIDAYLCWYIYRPIQSVSPEIYEEMTTCFWGKKMWRSENHVSSSWSTHIISSPIHSKYLHQCWKPWVEGIIGSKVGSRLWEVNHENEPFFFSSTIHHSWILLVSTTHHPIFISVVLIGFPHISHLSLWWLDIFTGFCHHSSSRTILSLRI